MAAGATYTPIATTTIASAVANYTFSSIPSTYTDLVLISSVKYGSTTSHSLVQLNGDTATNYSNTFLYGTGSSAVSSRNSGLDAGYFGRAENGNYGVGITHFQNYANTTTYKTFISRGDAPSTLTIAYVNLWRSTAAITSMKLIALAGQNFEIGTTFTLYGIAAA
jgi:hypothetical protein